MVHIGQLIQKELYRQNRSITWFAEQLCCSRSNIYKIFSHSDINTMLLLKISVILHCNFFRYYSDTLGNIEKCKLFGYTVLFFILLIFLILSLLIKNRCVMDVQLCNLIKSYCI